MNKTTDHRRTYASVVYLIARIKHDSRPYCVNQGVVVSVDYTGELATSGRAVILARFFSQPF